MLKWIPSCGICAVCYPEILLKKRPIMAVQGPIMVVHEPIMAVLESILSSWMCTDRFCMTVHSVQSWEDLLTEL